MKPAVLAFSSLFLLALTAAPLRAQCGFEKLLDRNGSQSTYYGRAVEILADTVFIGAPQEVGPTGASGFVYVLKDGPAGWVQSQVLAGSDGMLQDNFGDALAVEGDTLIVGAPNHPGWGQGLFKGAVYVFEKRHSGWHEVQKLMASDAEEFQHFGHDLALHGNRLLVGAPGPHPTYSTPAKAAYVFERVGGRWNETAKLVAPALPSWGFGQTVALWGNVAVVGAPFDGRQGEGAAYVFDYASGTWSTGLKLTPQDVEPNDWFGYSVALGQDLLWVGASQDKSSGLVTGSATLFERVGGSWIERIKLYPPNPIPQMGFARDLRLRDGRLAIAAFSGLFQPGVPGSAFVYDHQSGTSTWSLTSFLQPFPVIPEGFAYALAHSGDRVVVGAPGDSTSAQHAGAAFVYELAPTTSTYCQAAPNSAGSGAHIGSRGSTSLVTNDFTLTANGCPPNVVGKFFYGPVAQQLPFGNGFGCVTGGVYRLLPILNTGAAGSVERWVDFTQPPASSGPGQILPGSTWNFQFWYRDPVAGGAKFNLTDGLSATFCP